MSLLDIPVDDMIFKMLQMRVEYASKKKKETVTQFNEILHSAGKINSIIKELRATPPHGCSGACNARLTPLRHWHSMRPFLSQFMAKIPESYPSSFDGYDISTYFDELETALNHDIEKAASNLEIGSHNATLSMEIEMCISWREIINNKETDTTSSVFRNIISNYQT